MTLASWFNHGADERLAGRAIDYGSISDATQREWMRMGWNDVNKNWGKLVMGRWPVKPLPGVKR